MTVFLLRRVVQSIVVILLVTVITFALLRAIPGQKVDPQLQKIESPTASAK